MSFNYKFSIGKPFERQAEYFIAIVGAPSLPVAESLQKYIDDIFKTVTSLDVESEYDFKPIQLVKNNPKITFQLQVGPKHWGVTSDVNILLNQVAHPRHREALSQPQSLKS